MGSCKRKPVIAKLAVCLAIVLLSGGASATEPSDEPLGREVGPHCFPGAIGMPTPFLSTFVRASTGVASTSGMEVGFYDFEDPPNLLVSKNVDLQYLLQEFEFQQRIGRDFAVKAALAGSGRLGTGTAALVTEGVSVITSWTLGGTMRLAERPGFKLGGSLEATGNSLTAISIRNFVEDVLVNGLSDSTNSAVQDLSNLRMNAGLRAAWGRNRTIGYLAYGDIGFQEPYGEGEDTDVYWKTGGAVSIDMQDKWRPDLGFLLGAVYQSESGRNSDIGGGGWQTGLGIFYTGRRDLTAGIQTVYTELKQAGTDDKFGAYAFSLVLRYDFR